MAGPEDLRRLINRIRDLRATFLPDRDPVGNYLPADYDRIAAFLLLGHAEVESFIEQRCLEIASEVVAKWAADSEARSTIVALTAFSHRQGQSGLPESGAGRSRIREVVDEAKKSYSAVVHKNNGIKEKNLLELYLPLGLRESQFPSGFLAAMDTFGTERGGFAHTGIGSQTPPDPVEALNRVTQAVVGLWRLDRHLLALKAE